MIIHKLFYYWNVSLICSLDSRLMKPQMKYNPVSGFINCIFYRNFVNTLTPTLFKSKSFSFRVPKSHSPERNAKLAIRPKNTNNNILVLIPEMKENKWYTNCFWIFFPFAQWTQWIIVMLHQLFSHSFDCIDRQKPLRSFPVSKVFLYSPCAKFHVPVPGWTERFKQVHKKYFILHSGKISLNFIHHFAFNKVTLEHVYCCAVVQALSKMHENELFWFVKKWESASTYTLLCIISFLNWVHTIRRKQECFVHTVFLQVTVHSVASNKSEVSRSQC